MIVIVSHLSFSGTKSNTDHTKQIAINNHVSLLRNAQVSTRVASCDSSGGRAQRALPTQGAGNRQVSIARSYSISPWAVDTVLLPEQI